MKDILRAGFAALGLPAAEETVAQFARFGELLAQKNAVMNLTAITEPAEVARLHFLDCAALSAMADFSAADAADVGCGAGFPGLPLKLLNPGLRLTMLDSAGKKIEFCRQTADALGLADVECVWGRAEELPELRERFDLVVSRAVAELSVLAELCLPLTRVGGKFLAMKGPACEKEAADADFAIRALGGRVLDIRRYVIPGTDVTHAAVIVEKVKKTPPQYPRRYAQIKKTPLRG